MNHSIPPLRGLLALLCVAAAMAGALLSPTLAHAWDNSYCGVLLNVDVWCGDGTNHTYDYNRAEYQGAGDVWVCERLLWADTTSVYGTPACAYDYAAHNYGTNTSSLFEAEVKHKYSSGRHTIYGYAIA